jgi:hypothetical protein
MDCIKFDCMHLLMLCMVIQGLECLKHHKTQCIECRLVIYFLHKEIYCKE